MFNRASGLVPGAALMPTLCSLSGEPDIPVDRPLVLVGRHPSCDSRLESEWVSLRHCVLAKDGGDVVVRDLGSTNGTSINGRRVDRGRLRLGDEMTIAHIRYRLERVPALEVTEPIFRDRFESPMRDKLPPITVDSENPEPAA
jgi:pSer/pThr/pTyr-binding forkhead associated (FHA) protein